MSKYVCNKCGAELATKHSLDRHKYTSRCKNRSIDAVDLTRSTTAGGLKVPRTEEDDDFIKSFIEKRHTHISHTIFRNSFTKTLTTFKKRCTTLKISGNTLVLNKDNVPGQLVGDLIINNIDSNSDNEKIQYYHNDVKLFELSVDAITMIAGGGIVRDVNIHNLIFGKQFIPLDEIKIVFTGIPMDRTIQVESYILSDMEAKRFRESQILEHVCFGWFETNVIDEDKLPNLIEPIESYVTDIIYGGEDSDAICEDYSGFETYGPIHYSTVPNSLCTEKFSPIDDTLIASVITPGARLFKKLPEKPVIIRYLIYVSICNGKTYCHQDLYDRIDPILKEKREIKSRIEKIKADHIDTTLGLEKIEDCGTHGYMLLKNIPEHSLKVKVPAEWSPHPEYSRVRQLYQPDWLAFKKEFPQKPLFDTIIKRCEDNVPGYMVIEDKYRDFQCPPGLIFEPLRTNDEYQKLYVFRIKVNDDDKEEYYGFSQVHYDMYCGKFRFPPHPELMDAVSRTVGINA